MSNQGILYRLTGGETNVNKKDEKTMEKIQDKLLTVDKCNNIQLNLKLDAFSQWLRNFFKRDDKKSMDINTKVRYYITKDLNNKGTRISDFDIIVENESMPFTKLDQVDYFLKNYIDSVNNSRLDNNDPRKKEDSYYFQKIEKKIPFYPIRKEVAYELPSDDVDKSSQGGKKIKKHNKTKSKRNKNHKKSLRKK